MRWLIALAILVWAGAAHAQTSVVCGPYEAQWAGVAKGTNVAAMDRVIAKIPELCSDLKSQAIERRDQVESTRTHPSTGAAVAAAPSASQRLRAARADADLKIPFDVMTWFCHNAGPDGFDLVKSYSSFPDDKLVLADEVRTTDSDGKHITVKRQAKGPSYSVEYRYQISTSDNSQFGYEVYIESVDSVSSPLFTSPEKANKWLGAFGDVEAAPFGPTVGFGAKNTMLNIYPLTLTVWPSTYMINIGWFGVGGLRFTPDLCKNA